jgi:hypothetical protein
MLSHCVLRAPTLLPVRLSAPVQESVDSNKPPGAKGQYWKTMHVCTTMGPSLRINTQQLQGLKVKGE